MPGEHEVKLSVTAQENLRALDRSDQILVLKQLEKLKRAPQLGAPLGTRFGLDLSGFRKLYVARKRLRIIYSIQDEKLLVLVVAVGPREDAKVYRVAEAEVRRLRRIG